MITPIQHAKQQKQQSARFCPCCGQIAVVAKGEPSPWPKVSSDMIAASPVMLDALRLCINSVECASVDQITKKELPWYTAAKKAIRRASGALYRAGFDRAGLSTTGKDTL